MAGAIPGIPDADALDAIAHMLRDPEWGVGMLEDIEQWVSATGGTPRKPAASAVTSSTTARTSTARRTGAAARSTSRERPGTATDGRPDPAARPPPAWACAARSTHR